LSSLPEWTFPETSTGNSYEFHLHNGFFEHVDAELTWSLVRQTRPRRVIEVGSGNTTLLLRAVLDRNAAQGFPGELLSIDPHPSPALRQAPPGLTDLNSDVLCECLQILPRLVPGVLIHFHDILTPFDYPEKYVMTNLCFWGEEYLLEAFLSFNAAFRVLWASSAMQKFHDDILHEAFPAWQDSYARMPEELRVFVPTLDGRDVWPCSLWITRE